MALYSIATNYFMAVNVVAIHTSETNCNKHTSVCIRNEQEPEAPARNMGKPDSSIWQTEQSDFIGTDGSQGHYRASTRCSSSSQVASGWGRGVSYDNFGGCGGG
jgi:hypothetical protein